MKRKTKVTVFLILGLMLTLITSAYAQPSNSNSMLKQYVSDLQNNPNDYVLREKIIRLVQHINPQPAIPEEARKYIARGMAAVEVAKSDVDFKEAISEFEKAVNIAPWLGDGYRNLGIAQYQTGQYDAAIKNLNLYLLTNPADAEKAKSLIYKIEFRKEKAQKEVAAHQEAIQQRLTEIERIQNSLVGSWESPPRNATLGDRNYYYINTNGNTITITMEGTYHVMDGTVTPLSLIKFNGTMSDYSITGTYEHVLRGRTFRYPFSGTISPAGDKITITTTAVGYADSGFYEFPGRGEFVFVRR